MKQEEDKEDWKTDVNGFHWDQTLSPSWISERNIIQLNDHMVKISMNEKT